MYVAVKFVITVEQSIGFYTDILEIFTDGQSLVGKNVENDSQKSAPQIGSFCGFMAHFLSFFVWDNFAALYVKKFLFPLPPKFDIIP